MNTDGRPIKSCNKCLWERPLDLDRPLLCLPPISFVPSTYALLPQPPHGGLILLAPSPTVTPLLLDISWSLGGFEGGLTKLVNGELSSMSTMSSVWQTNISAPRVLIHLYSCLSPACFWQCLYTLLIEQHVMFLHPVNQGLFFYTSVLTL